MEQMVTDGSITKVIIVSDRAYAEKSDKRTGGAGTEAQIISPRLYAGEDEGKFVALVFERDELGKAYLPAYYTSRIFIDFTNPVRATDSFEQLVRWVYDKPLHKKPDIGRAPAYLDEGKETVRLATGAAYRRALDAVQNSRPHAFAATQEYLNSLTDQLPAFRIDTDTDPLSDEIAENYRSFLTYRDELLGLVRAVALTDPDPRHGDALHTFLEGFLAFFHPPPETRRFKKFDFDNYRFFAHELLLYFCSIAMEGNRQDLFEALVGRPYYDHVRGEMEGAALATYETFQYFDHLLEHRNRELGLRRPSLHADWLKERTAGTGVRFEKLQQTDFILFLRHKLLHDEPYYTWSPITFYVSRRGSRPLEAFARAQSKRELARLIPYLGLEDRQALDTLVQAYRDGTEKAPSFDGGWGTMNIPNLVGAKELGQKP